MVEKEKQTRNRKSKLKYQCPDCEKIAWQKEESRLICGECNQEMETGFVINIDLPLTRIYCCGKIMNIKFKKEL